MSVYQGYQLAFAGAARRGDISSWHRDNATPSWYQTIPPERVGLDGQYDYYGLRNRVEAAFRERFEHQALSHLCIGQRGRVVILQGKAESREVLRHLIATAEQIEGTIRVEATSVIVGSEVSALAVS